MYVQERNGKFRAFESYTYMGKKHTASVTMDRNTTSSRKDAQRKLAAIISDATAAGRSDKTFGQLVGMYLKEQKATVKESTWRRNSLTMKVLTELIGSDVPVSGLTSGYVRSRLLSHTTNPVTLNEYQTRLRAMLRWAASMEYIPDDSLARHLTRFPSATKKERTRDKYLEPDELRKVLQAADGYHRPVIEFLALSGLRIGEFIALEDRDVTDDSVRVTKTYDYMSGVTTTPKTQNSVRDVYVTTEMKKCIREIRSCTRNLKLVTGHPRASAFILSREGRVFSYNTFSRYFRRLTQEQIGRPLQVHSLRHTCVSIYASRGVPLETISRRLGHSDSSVTRDVYLHTTKDVKAADARLLEAVSFL